MIQYDDAEIDSIIWSKIADSKIAEDFVTYLQHKPEHAQHLDQAHEKFLALANGEYQEAAGFAAAIQVIKKMAEHGNSTAMFHAGKAYSRGHGVSIDKQVAETWYKQAVALSELRSMVNLACMHLDGEASEPSREYALELFHMAADKGEPVAMYRVALLLLEKSEASDNSATSIELLKTAYEQGLDAAGTHLAYLYLNGRQTEKNSAAGLQWLEAVAARGANGKLALGIELLRGTNCAADPERGIRLLTQAFEAGEVRASEVLGDAYRQGIGVEKALEKACYWYEAGAKHAEPQAMINLAALLLQAPSASPRAPEAKSLLEKAWHFKNQDAAAALGHMYLRGDTVPQNDELALQWSLRAAELGATDACFTCGWMLDYGRGAEANPKEAEKWYRRAAEAGHVGAQDYLGRLYLRGIDGMRNSAEGVKWLSMAADNGSEEAAYALGVAYLKGFGVIANAEEGLRLVRRAAEASHANAQEKLAELLMYDERLDTNQAEGMDWYRKAAAQGHAKAQGMLAWQYFDGEAVEINDDEAFKWAQLAALQENLIGQWILAECYLLGRGTGKNIEKAKELLIKSGKAGFTYSQRRLAEMYYFGFEVEQDLIEAGKWAGLAADQGDPRAQTIVGEMFAFGNGVEVDPVAAAAWIEKAAAQNSPRAAGLLGVMYAEGIGVKRDWITALKWLKKAADRGDDRAIDFLKDADINYTPRPLGHTGRLSPEMPIAKNPTFDVSMIPGIWHQRSEEDQADISIHFNADGAFRAEGNVDGGATFSYSGRWAVVEDKLLWDITESDLPMPEGADTDDLVISISPEEWILKDTAGKLATYRREKGDDAQKGELADKIIPFLKPRMGGHSR